ncbi:hypothetical protein Tco_1330326, partial [Tanacetum coccineum]
VSIPRPSIKLEYYVPESLHHELPSLEDNIVDFREGKVGVYTKNFKFTNYRIPISQFLFDILCHFQIHLSQLSVIGAAKVSHFKINCRRTSALKDERPAADSYSAVDVATLNLHRTPIQKEPEELLCLVGLCRNYFLRDDENPTFLYDDDREMDLFNLINAPNPLKVKTGACPRLSHEVPLLTATASCVINMENTPTTSVSSETPPVIVKSPLDFSNEQSLQLLTEGDETETQVPTVVASEVPRAENPATTGVIPELNLEKEAATMGPSLNKRDKGEAEANALPRVLRKDHASIRPQLIISSMISSKKAAAAEDPDSKKSISFTSMGGPPEDIYQPGWGVTNNCLLDTPEACQDMVDHIVPPGYFSVLRHLPNDDFLGQYNVNLARQVAMGSQLRLRFEQEAKLLKKAVARVARRDQRIQAREVEIKNLEALLEAEADTKKAAKTKNAELLKELDKSCFRRVQEV